MLRLIALVLLPVFVSCAGPRVDRTWMPDALADGNDGGIFDPGVERLLEAQPSTTGPLRIAVAAPWIHPRSDRRADHPSGWRREEREAIARWGKELQEQGIVSQVMLMPSILMDERRPHDSETHFTQARRAAARQGADAVLVSRLVTDIDQAPNVLAILDITLIGAFLFDGHEVAALTLFEGAVVDVRTEYVYTTAIGEGEGFTSQTLADHNPGVAAQEARLAALEDLASMFTMQSMGHAAK